MDTKHLYNGHIQLLQTLDSLIFTCFIYSKGLKCLTLLIIETYTLVCPIFQIFQFIIYKPSNIINTSFIFNILQIYKYQGELLGRRDPKGKQLIGRTDPEPLYNI